MSENEEKNDLPSVKDIRDQITVSLGQEVKAQSNFERDFKNASIAQQAEYAHLAGLVDHYRHKGRWSWFLMALLFLMIFFQCLLLFQVGRGEWDFTKYEWLLPILLVQNLGQIISLAFVVIKSLFKDL
jgi:hypothetical protein